MLAVLGRFGPYVGGLGPLLGPMFAVLGPLGTYVASLRPLLGPILAVLGRSWGLCWRSEAALGIYAGGPGSRERWERREAPKDPICLRARYAFFL